MPRVWGLALVVLGCASQPLGSGDGGLRVVTATAPSEAERYCAWFGARDGDRLYFGQAAFWSSMRAADGDPTADLREPGPLRVGRFDLANERLLPPLEVATSGGEPPRSGVWDVAVQDGRLYFTTFYEDAGSVDLRSGELTPLALGGALNEWAAGPDGTLLVTRYGSGGSEAGDGAVLAVSERGRVVRFWPLVGPEGYRVAPKTPAWDATREELWVTTDLLAISGSGGVRHDAYVLGLDGRELRRIGDVELHFVATAPDGTFYRAELDDRELSLVVRPPPGRGRERRVPLDYDFPAQLDFVQDIQFADDGRVVLTRWGGRVHVLHPDGSLRSAQLPRLDPDGVYYTGVLHGDRLCATHCADVSVVCMDAP